MQENKPFPWPKNWTLPRKQGIYKRFGDKNWRINLKKKAKNVKNTNNQCKNVKSKIVNIEGIPTDILFEIFSFLSPQELIKVSEVNRQWKKISSHSYLNEARETLCFHTKKTFEEDVIGFGINVEKRVHKYNGKTSITMIISTPLDFICKSAFYEEGVRLGVYKDNFTHWLPLYINNEHAQRGIEDFKKTCVSLYQDQMGDKFHPNMAIDLLSKLMKSMIVDTMKGNVHASIKYLEGYMHFHRWLLYFVMKYPQELDKINTQIKDFISHRELRQKKVLL